MRTILIVCLLLITQSELTAQSRTLEFYIEQSLKNSPLLKDYQIQIASNGIDSQRVKATFKPQIGLNGQLYYTPGYNGYGYDNAVTNGGNYQGQLAVSQPLIIHKSKQAQLQNIELQNQYLANSGKLTELDIKKAVTDQYIIAYKDFRLIQSAQEVLSLFNEEEEIIKPLIQRGIYAQTDFLNIHLAKENQLLSLRQSQIQYKNDLYALHILCGIEDTIFLSLTLPMLKVAEKVDWANSILLRQYRIDSFKFINRKKLVDLNYQPKLSAFADAGFWTSNIPTIYKSFGVGLGLNFSMPIYDGGQRKFEYQKIDLASQISKNYGQYYRKQYRQQLLQLHEQLTSTEALIEETNEQIKLAQDVIGAYRSQLDKGLVKVTDLVLTVNNYINFKTSLNQTIMTRLQIINQLNYFK